MNANLNLDLLVSQIFTIITRIVGYALLLLIAAAVLGHYGVKLPWLPAVSETALAYLCGAWFLYRGGK